HEAGEGRLAVGRPDREHRVTEAFVALADTLVDDYDIIELLDQLVGYCVDLLAADAAGLLLGDARQQLRVVAASSEDAATVELLQLQAEEGPCLQCYRDVAQVRVPDLSQVPDRWPRFVSAVLGQGAFASVHAIPLRLRGQAIGAVNLFHRTPGPLPEPDLGLAQALADVATIGIVSERAIRRGEVLNEQLQTALDSRVVIEQAKGILSQRLGISVDLAFELLRRLARSDNRRLSDLARDTVEGRLDLRAANTGGGSGSRRAR
ncbi:MAG TPA: GAF and ANTAR domain-containing protein, partial [Pseudonocardia sp.]|nr:GAF and ANTAR domain-containing protein [Pseudonocardia sp.]